MDKPKERVYEMEGNIFVDSFYDVNGRPIDPYTGERVIPDNRKERYIFMPS